jgi:hypothetical protein
MSWRSSRSEWWSYGFLALAAAVAVCLQVLPIRAEVELAPAYPVEAQQPQSEVPPEASRNIGGTANELADRAIEGPLLTLDLRAPEFDDNSAVTIPLGNSELTASRLSAAPGPSQSSKNDQTDAIDDEPAPSAAPTPEELTPELIGLREKVRKVLAMYYPRHQNARDNNAWEIMHAVVAYGVDTQIYKNGPRGAKVNAIGWLCYNYPCAGERMMVANRGKLEARRGVGVQGHHGQFLAILAQSRLTADYPMYVGGKQFTLADLIDYEQQNCFAGEELTFKLIALMHYLDSDETWTNRDGETWSIQRLIREELAQPIRGVACGGTHRLMGFSYAINKRIKRGEPVVGEFRRAEIFINDYQRYTFGLQNRDGSFSTEWFVRKGANPDIDRRIKTSGHILEWIAFSVSEEELRQPRMIKAVDYIADLLATRGRHKWEIGPLGHALHGLAVYDSRVFRPVDLPESQTIVESKDGSEPAIEARRDVESTR